MRPATSRSADRIETVLLAFLAAVLAVAFAGLWPRGADHGLTGDAEFTADGRFLVQSGDGSVQVVDLATGAVRHRIDLGMPEESMPNVHPYGDLVRVTALTWTPDRKPDRWLVFHLDPVTGRLSRKGDLPYGSGFLSQRRGGWTVRTTKDDAGGVTATTLDGAGGANRTLSLPHENVRQHSVPHLSDGGRMFVQQWFPRDTPEDADPTEIGLTVWDTRRGAVVRDDLRPPSWQQDLAISEDGAVAIVYIDRSGPPPTHPVHGRQFRDFRLWLARPGAEAEHLPMPPGDNFAAGLMFAPDGRTLAVTTWRAAILRNSKGERDRRDFPPSVALYDVASGERIARWTDRLVGDHLELHFTGDRTLLIAGHRTGRVMRMDVPGGAVTHLFTVRPPGLSGPRSWFVHAVALTLLAWAALWLGGRRRSAARDDIAMTVAALLVAGWVAVRLLPERLLLRSPSVWPWLPDAVIDFPERETTLACLSLAAVVVAWTLAAAFFNRRRPGRLCWLLVLSIAYVAAPALADLDRLAGAEILPERLHAAD